MARGCVLSRDGTGSVTDVGNFSAVAAPGERLDPATIRDLGSVFASYVDKDRSAPMHDAVSDLVAEPMVPEQLLNSVVGLANVVALLILTLGQDEDAATELATGIIARAAGESTSGIFSGPDDPLHSQVQAWICRVYGTAPAEDFPVDVAGLVLVGLAAYGDAAVVLADRVGIPRDVLGPALTQAAAKM